MSAPPFAERMAMLDAWRGVAALAVVAQHVGYLALGVPAVMLFFVVSGYCVMASLDAHVRKGAGVRFFLLRRVRRIYPPYLLSLVFYLGTRLAKKFAGQGDELERPAIEYVQNATLTQWMTLVSNPSSMPFENPVLFVSSYWSLCYEEQFYFVMGLILAYAAATKRQVIWPIVGVAALGIAWNVQWPNLSFGVFIEYWVLFAIGCLVFLRLCRFRSAAARRSVDLSLLALVCWSGWMAFRYSPSWKHRFVYDEWLVAALFGLILIASRRYDERFARSIAGKLLRPLGTISFSLYLVHQFNVVAMRETLSRLLSLVGLPGPVPVVLELAGHIALASVFWYLCERPFLNRALEPSAATLPVMLAIPTPPRSG